MTAPDRGVLWPVRIAALLSLPPIAALCGAVESRNLAVFLGVVFSLPWLALPGLLAFPARRSLTSRALELGIIAGVIGTAVFGVMALPVLLRGRLPAAAAAVCWSFPAVQVALVLAARRAQRARPGPPLPAGVRVLLAVVFLVTPLALSSPLLLGAHPHGEWWTNEQSAQADVRTLISAQFRYQAASGGRFGSVACLTRPSQGSGGTAPEGCAPPPGGAGSLPGEMASSVRRGYRFELHLARGSDGAPETFAYTAVPLSTGGYPAWRRTGGRSFCGDSTGRVCSVPDGGPPPLEAGLCAASCPSVD